MPKARSSVNNVVTTSVLSADFTTLFPATENPISQSAIWLNGQTNGVQWQDVRTTPGLAFGTGFAGDRFEGSAFDDNLAHLKSSFRTFNANQFVQGVVHYTYAGLPTAQQECELLARFDISSNNARGYEVLWGCEPGTGGYLAVVKWVGALGDFKTIYDSGSGGAPTPTENDVLLAEFVGTNATVKINGSLFTVADLTKESGGTTLTTWSTGQPGIGFWPVHGTGQDPAKYCWKSFTAGDL